jgi:hypothetical protein
MKYLMFTLWFTLLHAAAYTLAGALILKISKDVYEGRGRLMIYLRDMSDEGERGHVERMFFPGQLLRGVLMSIVLYPILPALGELSFALRFAFLGGLMFVFTHLAAVAPAPDNIEGYVYMKEQYFNKAAFLKFQAEMLVYTLVFSLAAASLLF